MSKAKSQALSPSKPSRAPSAAPPDVGSNQAAQDQLDADKGGAVEASALTPAERSVHINYARWTAEYPILTAAAARLLPIGEAAATANATGDSGAVQAARASILSTLRGAVMPLRYRQGIFDELYGLNVDTSILEPLLAPQFSEIWADALTPAFARSWIATRYEGANEAYDFPVSETAPSTDGNLEEMMLEWTDFIDGWVDDMQPTLEQVPEVRAWASEHHDDLETGVFQDKVNGTLGSDTRTILLSSPVVHTVGRERAYLTAVLKDAAPEPARSMLNPYEQTIQDQMSAEDQLDFGEEIDFEALEEALDAVGGRLDETFLNDRAVLAALNEAESPTEREYMLRRLLHDGNLDAMTSRLGEDAVAEYDDYRSEAGYFAGAGGAAGDDKGALEYGLDGLALTPSSVIANGAGAIGSVPLLGDFYEKYAAPSTLQFASELSQHLGVDEKTARMSANVGYGCGKVSGTVAQMVLTGGSSNAAKAAKTGLTALDMTNNTIQAVLGHKATGKEDKVEGLERASAFVGLGGSLLGGINGLRNADNGVSAAADAASGASDLSRASRLANFGLEHSEDALGLVSQGLKTADAVDKSGSVVSGVASKSDDEVSKMCGDWARANPGPRASRIERAMSRNDMALQRRLATQIEREAASAGLAEHSTAGAALPMALLAGAARR